MPLTSVCALAAPLLMITGLTGVCATTPAAPNSVAAGEGAAPHEHVRTTEAPLAAGAEVRLTTRAGTPATTAASPGSHSTSIPIGPGDRTSPETTSAPVPDAPTAAEFHNGAVSPTQSFWLHLNSTPVSDAQLAQEARRRAYIVLNAWESSFIPKLKAANPNVRVFVYKDLSSTRSYACRNSVDDLQLPAGVGHCYADRQHPEWFLRGADGQRLQYAGYSGHWQMDVGDVAYQNTWIANVISTSTASGFDGVLMDNALFGCDTYHDGVCPAKYPDDKSFQNAYESMLANARGKFASAGLLTVANLANARRFAGAWDAYTEHLDGAFDEWWLTFSDTNLLPEYEQGWSRQLAEISSNEARGKITLVQPHFTEGAQRPFRYALASFLMVSGPRSAFAPIAKTDGYGDPSALRAEQGWTIGAPSGTYRPIGANLFRRDFTCGAVVVNANPASSGAVTVPLGGTYTDEESRSVTSASLVGTSGTILRRPC